MRRYSYQPVADLLGGTNGTQAEILGTTRRTVIRWTQEGLSREKAEELADRLRSHVYELWPEMLEHDAEDAEDAERRRREAKNAYRRAYYQRHRDRELAHRRAYYEENRDRILRKASARYWGKKADA